MECTDGIRLITVNGGGSTLLRTNGTSARYYTPYWSPDGKWVTYLKVSSNGSRHVCRMPAAGGTEVSLTNDFVYEWTLGWTAE